MRVLIPAGDLPPTILTILIITYILFSQFYFTLFESNSISYDSKFLLYYLNYIFLSFILSFFTEIFIDDFYNWEILFFVLVASSTFCYSIFRRLRTPLTLPYKKFIAFMSFYFLSSPLLASAYLEECQAVLAAGGTIDQCTLTDVQRQWLAMKGICILCTVFVVSIVGTALIVNTVLTYGLRFFLGNRLPARLVAQSGYTVSFDVNRLSNIIHILTHMYGFYRDAKQPFTDRDYPNLFFAIWRYCLVYYRAEDLPKILSIVCESKVEFIDIESQSGTARKIFDQWKDLNDSELAQKMNKVLIGLMTCTLTKNFKIAFTESGFKDFMHAHDPKIRFTSSYQLLMDVVEFTLTFAEIGYECFLDRSTRPLVIRDRAVRQWVIEYESLCHLLDERPVTQSFDAVSTLDHMNSLLARGLVLMKTHMSYINMMYKDLSSKKSTILREYNVASHRKSPFSILFHGPPGTGKSSAINLVGTIYHQVVKQSFYPDLDWNPMKNVYTHNVDDNFFSGYKGMQQWLFVMDDMARAHKNLVARGLDTSIPKIITIVNSIGIATEQAALEDKGCIPLIPKVVVATTNVKDLNAGLAMAEKAAVLRRFPIVVRPYVKPEYYNETTGMMKKLDVVVHDAWEYQVELVRQIVTDVPNSDANVEIEYLPVPGTGTNQRMTGAEFSMFLKVKIEEHESNAAVMFDSLTPDANISMCEHGTISHFACPKCVETQAWFWQEQTRQEKIVKYLLKKSIDWCPLSALLYANRFFPVDLTKALLISKIKTRRIAPSFVNEALRMSLVVLCSALITHKLLSFVLKRIIPDLETQANIWQKEDNSFIVPSRSKEDNHIELRNTLARAAFRLTIKAGNEKQEVSCFALRNGWYVTVQHPFEGTEWQCIARYKTKQHSLDASNAFVLTEKSLVRLPNDLVMFWCSSILPRKGIYDFLPEKIDTKGRSMFMFDPRLDYLQPGQTTHYHEMKYEDSHGDIIHGTFMDGVKLSHSSVKGDCGALCMSKSNKGYYVSGMHCAGSAGGGPRIILTQLSKELFKDEFPPMSMAEADGIPKYVGGSKKSGKLGPCAEKGVHQWCEGNAMPLGSYPGRSTHTSQTTQSTICSEVEAAFNFKNPFVKPLMKAILEDGEWKNPFNVATIQQADIKPFTTDEAIVEVQSAFVEDLSVPEKLQDVAAVDISIAINGIPGDSYINRLPMSTSGGFYFPGSKRQYFSEIWVGEELFQTPCEELINSINEIEFCYLSGQRAYPVFQGSLKDEPISEKKRFEGRTRVFTACGVAFAIVVRKQFLKITKFFMINNFLTECAVSMNCYSKEWHHLYHYLVSFGDKKIIAGDYKAFDKQMAANWIRAAFQVLIDLRKYAGQLTIKDEKICVGVATDICFPVTNMNGDLIQFFGGNSSGHPLTVIINSIVNSLYIRSAYASIVKKPLGFFKKDVKLMTLGDDNIYGSNVPAFNHTTIADFLATKGITYTMADKDSDSVPFINIRDADFLKRTFRKLDGRIVAPLALKSIFKSLCMIVKKGNISDEEQLAQSYLAARREWSLHGKVVFDGCCDKMTKIFSNHQDVTRFFIKQHSYDYETTLEWVLNG